MSQLRAGFLPLGRINFDMEAAGKCLAQSKEMLKNLSPGIICPEGHLNTYDDMTSFIKANAPFDFIIVQAATFVDPRFCLEFRQLLKCPVLLWGVREPSIAEGTRLRLNSLTGVMAQSQLMHQLGAEYEFIYGNADEPKVRDAVARWVRAGEVAARIRGMKLGVVGSIPPGYFFSLEEEVHLRSKLGPQVVPIEVYKIIHQVNQMPAAEKKAVFEQISAPFPGMKEMPEEKQLNFAGFYKAVRNFVDQNKLDAICGRCWPDSFEGLGIAFCAAYSLIGSDIPVGCEADQGGALTQAMLSWLGGMPGYLADVVALDEKADTITMWHCGYGSPKLANPNRPLNIGVHPNRRMPPIFEFPMKPGRVTLSRLGKRREGGYRLFVAGGECQDEPLQFAGTSAVIKVDHGSEPFLRKLIDQGWEYHVGMVHKDVREELATLGRLMGIEVIRMD